MSTIKLKKFLQKFIAAALAAATLFFGSVSYAVTTAPKATPGPTSGPDTYVMEEVEAVAGNSTLDGLKAKAYILAEANSGITLVEKNKDDKLPIASITKIMSMLLIMEALDSGKLKYDQILTTSVHAASLGLDTSSVYSPSGETNSVNDLLKAVAIHSANDATIVLAEQVGGTEPGFVNMMNAKAAELGMKNTNFLDCTGLIEAKGAEKAYCSAADVVLMARELLLKHPKILEYTSIWHDTFRNGEFSLDNTNKLVNSNPWVTGLKTGYNTEAGYCLCASGEKNGVKVITVVLGEESTNLRFAESIFLLEYGITNYETTVVNKKDEIMSVTPINKGVKTKINAVLEKDANLTYKKGEIDKISKESVIKEKLTAPVTKGQVIGEMIYKLNGVEITRINLLAEQDMKKASWITLFFRMVGGWFSFGKK